MTTVRDSESSAPEPGSRERAHGRRRRALIFLCLALCLPLGLMLAAGCADPDKPPAPAAVAAAEIAAPTALERDELTRSWAEASRDVSNLVYAIEDRLDALAEAKKLPKNLDKAAVAWARASLASIQASWATVPEEFERGDQAQAVAKARGLAAQGSEILGRIGVR